MFAKVGFVTCQVFAEYLNLIPQPSVKIYFRLIWRYDMIAIRKRKLNLYLFGICMTTQVRDEWQWWPRLWWARNCFRQCDGVWPVCDQCAAWQCDAVTRDQVSRCHDCDGTQTRVTASAQFSCPHSLESAAQSRHSAQLCWPQPRRCHKLQVYGSINEEVRLYSRCGAGRGSWLVLFTVPLFSPQSDQN